MKIGICGKPSSGKSSFFSAATLIDVPISSRPFTTIKPNVGITYVRAKCPHEELGTRCNPRNSICENGTRLVPMTIIDVAGLVPDAHLGRGLGNQFLNDLMAADGLIHTVDISGTTDENGNPAEDHNPAEDVRFLEREIDWWIAGILERNWKAVQKNKEGAAAGVYEQLAGLGISASKIKEIVDSGYSGITELATKIRKENKPIVIAANKIDLDRRSNLERVKKETNLNIIPCCAAAELALRKANTSGIIKYVPGASDFEIIGSPDDKQKKGLEFIRESILKKWGSTGVQKAVDELVFGVLRNIVVYPVEDENKFSDKSGNILPDAFLVREGSTALDLAFKVHTDIGKGFIGAVDARTKKKVGKEYALRSGDVIKIIAR